MSPFKWVSEWFRKNIRGPRGPRGPAGYPGPTGMSGEGVIEMRPEIERLKARVQALEDKAQEVTR